MNQFIHGCVEIIKLKVQLTRYRNTVVYLQNKFRDKHLSKYQKVEVLLNYWDKLTGEIQIRCSKMKDQGANLLLRHLMMVPKDIKVKMMKIYIDKCREMHAIAFLQWR